MKAELNTFLWLTYWKVIHSCISEQAYEIKVLIIEYFQGWGIHNDACLETVDQQSK